MSGDRVRAMNEREQHSSFHLGLDKECFGNGEVMRKESQ